MGFLMKFRRTVLSVSISAAIATLSACGGGGGGGGGTQATINNQVPVQPIPVPPTFIRSEVPYSTPTLAVTVDPLVNNSTNGYKWAVADMFASNISSANSQDLVIAGRMTQPTTADDWSDSRISILSWQNGALVDRTSQWFPNDTNIILGTEPSVKFADFFKTGRNDMFVSTGTDMQHYGPTYFFRNTGTSFERQTLTSVNIWSHDSAVGDLNGDTYADIAIIDYGPNATLAFNNQVNGFTVYTQNQNNVQLHTGSSVAIGDFLQNGNGQLIVTDTPGPTGSNPTKLYTWSIDSNNQLNFTEHSTLPTPRFELPRWAGFGFVPGSHNVRVVTYDFDDNQIPDVIVFSRPALGTANNKYSEIQFLKNGGTGTFTDVTDNILVGYNTNTYVTYNPKFLDLNGDGREDILVSGADFTGVNDSTQILLKSTDGKYVAAYQNIFTDFVTQANSIQRSDNMGNTVNILKAPDGKLYLVTAVSFMNGNDRQLSVYMSELGTSSTTSAQNAVNLIQQRWPYMTVAQANAALAQTSATYFGGRVIDLETVLNPIGELMIPVSGQLRPLSGYIGGINLNGVAGRVTTFDSMGRDFSVNYNTTNVNMMNMFTRSIDNIDDDTRSSQLSGASVVRYQDWKFGVSADNRNMVLGTPGIKLGENTKFNMQYSRMPFSPFVQLNGSWGLVKSSDTVESTLTHRRGNWVSKLGVMYSATEIEKGLVNQVSPITSAWAEAGYEWQNFRFYTGILPKVLGGSADITLPTGVDNSGKVSYTNLKADVYGPTMPYVRFSYNDRINKQVSYRINGMISTQNQHSVIGEVKVGF
jgi:hypothetical protein